MVNADEKYLSILSDQDNSLGEFAKSFIDLENDEDNLTFINDWFFKRTELFFNQSLLKPHESIVLPELSDDNATLLDNNLRLSSILINYFRGFRKSKTPIEFNENLIVIEGRNSSGKTSLTEALEWLIAGKLSRRTLGDSKELENCISNAFKPEDQQTFVEAIFKDGENREIKLKRILTCDYGSNANAHCQSQLLLNGVVLKIEEENNLLNELFGSNLPILMQHTLNSFIKSKPSERSNYFEQLLNINKISTLIEKAVITNNVFKDFKSKNEDTYFNLIEGIKCNCQVSSSKSCISKLDKIECKSELEKCIETTLIEIAKKEFSYLSLFSGDDKNNIDKIAEELKIEQKKKIQTQVPIDRFRPYKTYDDIRKIFDQIIENFDYLLKINTNLNAIIEANKNIKESNLIIAKTLEDLITLGIIDKELDFQPCPLCEYKENNIKTLSEERIKEIQSWTPLQKSMLENTEARDNHIRGIESKLKHLVELKNKLLPKTVNDIKEQDVSDILQEDILKLKGFANCKEKELQLIEQAFKNLYLKVKIDNNTESLQEAKNEISSLSNKYFQIIKDNSINYVSCFEKLEQSISKILSQDSNFQITEDWLKAKENIKNITDDIFWNQSRIKAQDELKLIRDKLIEFRQNILNLKRENLNKKISEVWQRLRNDDTSYFNEIYIPKASGRGFKTDILVKAKIATKEETIEVDAIKVFSESQINVVGIAVFLARLQSIGNKIIILDDPVQSMDEEHFRTFSNGLLPYLIENGIQVIIFTHNNTFATDISYKYALDRNYTTLLTRNTRKYGCYIEEGNRKVTERLKKAEKCIEEGRLDDSWTEIRRALERLCKVVYIKEGPENFDMRNWSDKTIEYMWKEGVGEIIKQRSSEISNILQGIKNISNPAAHDGPTRGKTDALNSIKELRSSLSSLNIGDG